VNTVNEKTALLRQTDATAAQGQSLIAYIAWRLLGSFFVVVCLWFFISRAGYYFALDGTAEFYMVEDAENAIFLAQEGIAPDILNSGFRQFYSRFEDIPEPVRELIGSKGDNWQVNIPLYLETPGQDIYFLAYRQQASSEVFYLLHRFDKTDTLDLAPVFLLVDLVAFGAILAVMLAVIYRLKSQLSLLSLHLKKPVAEQGREPPELMIRDFNQALLSVKHHYREKQQVIKREREFANFLSHEIRQPLSKLNTNLALLDQLDDLPYASVEIIEDVKQLSEDLNQVSGAVLQLWLDTDQKEENIELAGLIRHLSHVLPQELSQDFIFAAETVSLKSNLALVKLLLGQLIKNAAQYAQTSIHFHLHGQSLEIINDVRPVEDSDPKDYGYGLGLVMAEKICHQLGWTLSVNQAPECFSVVLDFSNSRC